MFVTLVNYVPDCLSLNVNISRTSLTGPHSVVGPPFYSFFTVKGGPVTSLGGNQEHSFWAVQLIDGLGVIFQ
jgi:hypothetical protein